VGGGDTDAFLLLFANFGDAVDDIVRIRNPTPRVVRFASMKKSEIRSLFFLWGLVADDKLERMERNRHQVTLTEMFSRHVFQGSLPTIARGRGSLSPSTLRNQEESCPDLMRTKSDFLSTNCNHFFRSNHSCSFSVYREVVSPQIAIFCNSSCRWELSTMFGDQILSFST